MKKRNGQVGMILMVWLTIFLLLLTAYGLQLHQYRSIKTFTEDALAASNLASAVIDTQEYGRTHNILIRNPSEAYLLYQEALKINMQLNDVWESTNLQAISGKVEILDYIVYNVRGSDITIYCYGKNPYTTVISNGVGSVKAPNGTLIESTSIYSKITFPVNGMMQIQTTTVKDKLVDIVEN